MIKPKKEGVLVLEISMLSILLCYASKRGEFYSVQTLYVRIYCNPNITLADLV